MEEVDIDTLEPSESAYYYQRARVWYKIYLQELRAFGPAVAETSRLRAIHWQIMGKTHRELFINNESSSIVSAIFL